MAQNQQKSKPKQKKNKNNVKLYYPFPDYDFPNFKVENHIKNMYGKSMFLNTSELSATWNTKLIEKCGREIAKDIIRRKNETAISINLQGPESFSDAQYVNGKFASAFIRGAQSVGLFTFLKESFYSDC